VELRDIDLVDQARPTVTSSDAQVPITIEVVWGDIGSVAADVVAVGHYEGVYPTSAELALDVAISGPPDERPRLLHAATARGVLRGSLGDVFVVPLQHTVGRDTTAVVLGLGRPGSFQQPQQEVLVRNLVWSAERLLGATSVACVLIGSGAGNLSVDDTVDGLVRSLDAAVREHELTGQLRLIRIVESELGRARAIHDALTSTVSRRGCGTHPAAVDLVPDVTGAGGTVSIETALTSVVTGLLQEDPAALAERIARSESTVRVAEAMAEVVRDPDRRDHATFLVTRQSSRPEKGVPTRMSVLSIGGRLVGSAVSDAAMIPERDFGLGEGLFMQLVELANTQAADDPALAGRMLLRLAIRPEFRPLLDQERDVIIEVDRVTAALPWEILGSETATQLQLRPLGLRTALARQLRTRRSPPPVVTGRIVLTRALVIGDPAEGAQHLPGAEREALAVAAMLYDRGVPFDILLGAHGATDPANRWNAEAATVANVLHHLLHQEYQLVHYAGHGTFSAADPAQNSGWLLADGLLTGEHLTILERLPPLVVANACHSSRVSTGLPGLADEFMGHGVRNLVGTARTVNDESALRFSSAFYARLLATAASSSWSPTLGGAVLAARRDLADSGQQDWDVYQLYGDPSFRFWPDA
jgi:hypothetical protein